MIWNTEICLRIKQFLKRLMQSHQLKKHKNEFTQKHIALFLIALFLPSFAYAYGDGDGGTIATFIGNVCNLFSGKIAKGIGVLAIIGMGYACLKGRMDWHRGVYITIGMGMILGASYYGSTVFGN